MVYDKKDLDTLTKTFNALSKAKWNDLDGNAIIEIHNTFIALKKLEDKIKQGLNSPVLIPNAEEQSKKSSRKK